MDLNVMEINLGGVDCAVVTIEGMVATSSMAELIFRPLMNFKVPQKEPAQGIFSFCTRQSLFANERKIICSYGDIIQLLFFRLRSDPYKRYIQSCCLRYTGLR